MYKSHRPDELTCVVARAPLKIQCAFQREKQWQKTPTSTKHLGKRIADFLEPIDNVFVMSFVSTTPDFEKFRITPQLFNTIFSNVPVPSHSLGKIWKKPSEEEATTCITHYLYGPVCDLLRHIACKELHTV
jgi:hypothetical protein